jgi:L-lysine exporter family protein LysE/ArgO
MITATPASSINSLSHGFLLCISIIIAFGPQNLFLLRQGLRRQHLFITVLFSTLAEILLIGFAVGGLSALISTNGIIQTVFTAGGVLFLIWTGGRSLYKAWQPDVKSKVTAANPSSVGMQTAIVAALSFSLLNPATYLDTFVTIGTQSLSFPADQRFIFGIGAVMASAFWFFVLTYGASRLSPLFRSQAAWRTLDSVSGGMMLVMAITMLISSSHAL